MAKRRKEQTTPQERRERSEACRSWVKGYGKIFRDVVNCGKALKKLEGARSRDIPFHTTVQRCARTLTEASKHENVNGLDFVASCVRRGYSHGVLQRRRSRPQPEPRRSGGYRGEDFHADI
jgi:hypothetical protein